MKLRIAEPEELEKVCDIYRDIIDHTPDMDNTAKWIFGVHPTIEMIKGFIDNKFMYLYEDHDDIVGVVALTYDDDNDKIPWEIVVEKSNVDYLHLFAITPKYQGKGLARPFLLDIIKHSKALNKKAIKLDTLLCNKHAQHLYESVGFKYRGIINQFANNTIYIDFVFYELSLT